MRKGKYFASTKFIMGIELNPQRFKEVYDEVKSFRKPGDWYEEESCLFNLHEAVFGLNGYWIGNIEHPEGIIIGYDLESDFDINEENDNHPPGLRNTSLENLKLAIDDFERRCLHLFDYKAEIRQFCMQEENEVKLHIFPEVVWLNEETILSYASIEDDRYQQYKWVVNNDAWDYRAD
jgi:hypothetical protein